MHAKCMPFLSVGKLGWKLESTLSGYHERTVFSVDWSPTDMIASGSADNSICLFSPAAPAGGDIDASQQQVIM